MGCYQHLSIKERERILVAHKKGEGLAEIALQLGRSVSTISRELKRNTISGQEYSAVDAQQMYHSRRKFSVRRCKLEAKEIRQKVTELLEQYWSPEQISKRLRRENNAVQVCMVTIYRGLAKGLLDKPLVKNLRRKGKKSKNYQGCGHLPVTHSIHQRPKAANNRSRRGDWECDTVRGAMNSGCVATLVDRKSRYILCAKLPNRTAVAFNTAVIPLMRENIPCQYIRTLTCDHGKEFSQYGQLEKEMGCTVYFADPGCPGQRGTNENTNGLLRQFLPKRKKFTSITQDDVDAYAALLNHRPRKCLGWKTPFEVFFRTSLHLT